MFKKNRKKQKPKKRVDIQGEGELLASLNGYTFTPSFIKSGNRYGTILKVVNKYGMNRSHEFGWFVNLIPEINEEGVKGYFFETDKPMTQKDEADIMRENVQGNIKSNLNTMNEKNTVSENKAKELRVYDLTEASTLHAINNKIIDWKARILLVSDSADAIERQIDKLKSLYDDHIMGVELLSVGGDQEELFSSIFEPPTGSVYDYTSMSSQFAGNDHALRKGLDDPEGYPVGSLALSYSSGEAFMTLDKSFKERILIASHKESNIISYDNKLSSSSLWGQLVANNATVHGHKTFHIVMNGFKYFGENKRNSVFSCKPSINKILERVNMAKGGLNPLEMFGSKKDAVKLYNKNLEKNAHILYLVSGRQIDGDTKIKLKKALGDFYIDSNLWNLQAHLYPERIRTLGVKDHEGFPKYGMFINSLTNLKTEATNSGTERDVDRINLLQDTLQTALDSYMEIFNSPTTLPDELSPDIMQYYYDLSELRSDSNVMEAQFLNVFDYATNFAEKDDIIMIHGLDKVSVETLQLVQQRIEMLMDSGVRMAYLFDTIGGGLTKKEIETADIFNVDGILYEDFEHQFDYTILGSMTKEELKSYQNKIKQPLTKELSDYLTSDSDNQFQIRRPSDLTSNFVNADFII